MALTHNFFVSRIKAAPDKCQITLFVVEETLVREACVICVGLLEVIGCSTSFADNVHAL